MESRQFGCYRPGQWGRNPIDRPLGPLSIGVQTSPINDVYVGVIGQGQELSRGRDFSQPLDQERKLTFENRSEDSEESVQLGVLFAKPKKEEKSASANPAFTLKNLDNQRKLFFKPLNKKTKQEDALQAISRLGSVAYLRIPFSKLKNKNLGYGFVIFHSDQLANTLVNARIPVLIQGNAVTFHRFDFHKYKAREYCPDDSSDSIESKCKNQEELVTAASNASPPIFLGADSDKITVFQLPSFDPAHFNHPGQRTYHKPRANLQHFKKNIWFRKEPVSKGRRITS